MKTLFFINPLVCLTLLAGPALADYSVSGSLARRADPGFTFTSGNAGLTVSEVTDQSPAALAGLNIGDAIVSINGQRYEHSFEGRDLLRRLDGGDKVEFVVARDGSERQLEFVPDAVPFSDAGNVTTIYDGFKTSDGSHLRTALSHRQDATGPLPLVMLIQWVSCGIVTDDIVPELKAVMDALPVAVFRVERSSDGDSEGPACYELEYDTEIQHYVEALLDIIQEPRIDRSRIYLYGSSLGSTMAPLVAQELKRQRVQVAGLMVQGGGAVTYVERMINFDRINLERRNDRDLRRIHEEMSARILFQTEYLIKGRHPDDVAGDNPTMARVRQDILGLGEFDHYGRPFAWHQQAAQHDFLEAWLDVAAPSLIAFAEFDQFESRHGHRIIAEVLNREHPGLADYVELPNINHFNDFHTDIDQAYFRADGLGAIDLLASHMVRWLNEKLE